VESRVTGWTARENGEYQRLHGQWTALRLSFKGLMI
jgi:hypothetical protein